MGTSPILKPGQKGYIRDNSVEENTSRDKAAKLTGTSGKSVQFIKKLKTESVESDIEQSD